MTKKRIVWCFRVPPVEYHWFGTLYGQKPEVYLQACYPHPIEARLASTPARIKPDLFTRVINVCVSTYKCQ
jgi:hypothetical protein